MSKWWLIGSLVFVVGCGGASASYAAVAGACEAAEAALELECASTGGANGTCTGELTTEEYRDAIRCTRAACDAIEARIEAEAE